ncbi:MAG: hypothetical protein K0Q71_4938 [Thermomicrobiales bacterium]|jgi:hypothetical protein|nr:hypothetical protein [Thermomicrobiales bacterium]
MSTFDVRSLGRFGPYLVVVPFLIIIFGFYGTFLPFGPLGLLGMALVGLLWALALGFIANWLERREAWRARLANAPLLLGIVATGLMIGGGVMYGAMMKAALGEPSTTYAVLSALMQPAVPFYIVLNTSMELLLVPLLVLWNWDTGPGRKAFVLIGVIAYLAMRVWTYLVFAETRLDISQRTLSTADVAWFEQTLTTDFRIVLNVTTFTCFLLAAFVPASPPASCQDTADGRWTVPRWLPQAR